jgi:hypothetical protein
VIQVEPLLKKLNFPGNVEAVILDAPNEFTDTLQKWKEEGIAISISTTGQPVQFVLVFVLSKEKIQQWANVLAPLLQGDPTCWVAYPKGTSQRYKADFNRDFGWESLGELGFEAVRQVAIDKDWSALRFRKAAFIKSLKREPSRTISVEGRKRLGEKKP